MHYIFMEDQRLFFNHKAYYAQFVHTHIVSLLGFQNFPTMQPCCHAISTFTTVVTARDPAP